MKNFLKSAFLTALCFACATLTAQQDLPGVFHSGSLSTQPGQPVMDIDFWWGEAYYTLGVAYSCGAEVDTQLPPLPPGETTYPRDVTVRLEVGYWQEIWTGTHSYFQWVVTDFDEVTTTPSSNMEPFNYPYGLSVSLDPVLHAFGFETRHIVTIDGIARPYVAVTNQGGFYW